MSLSPSIPAVTDNSFLPDYQCQDITYLLQNARRICVGDRLPTSDRRIVTGQWDYRQDNHQYSYALNNPRDVVDAIATLTRGFVALFLALPSLIQYLVALYLIYKSWKAFKKSFRAFLDLGRGGTPSNFMGWCRIKWLSFFRLPSVLDPPHVSPYLEPYRGLLENIPKRHGPRPIIGGVAPQRQINQKAPRSTFKTLEAILREFAEDFPDVVYMDTSYLEGDLPALRGKETETSKARSDNVTFGYEIAHPHRSDGSLHMIMHPEDIRTVIETGWGERHPLARADWWWLRLNYIYTNGWFKFTGRPPVPEGLVFVYAPKTEEELKVIKELVKASAWWVTGSEALENHVCDSELTPKASVIKREARRETGAP